MKLLGVIALATLPFLAACNEENKSVEWWEENDQERKEKMAECRESEVSINCENARTADFRKRAIGTSETRNPIRLD
ncbi:EexN family lipoprotein [Halomonas casei]|uniref:EexN family lipoprotein n=1 Tax=Halomonas casei TaxID=2742613 RepID=UPI003CF17CC7